MIKTCYHVCLVHCVLIILLLQISMKTFPLWEGQLQQASKLIWLGSYLVLYMVVVLVCWGGYSDRPGLQVCPNVGKSMFCCVSKSTSIGQAAKPSFSCFQAEPGAQCCKLGEAMSSSISIVLFTQVVEKDDPENTMQGSEWSWEKTIRGSCSVFLH